MPKYKLVILTCTFLIFFMIDWFISNLPIIAQRELNLFAEQDIFLNLFDSVNGYSGILQLLVIYALPVLLGVYYLFDKDNLQLLLRYKSRYAYRKHEVFHILLVSAIFSGLHESINYILVNVDFENSIISQFDFWEYSTFNALLLFVFYVQVGLIYLLICDLITNRVFALFVTFFGCLCQFWICKFYIFDAWLPYRDLMITFEFLSKHLNKLDLILAIARNSIIAFILFLFCQMTFNKKDILENEK